MLFNITLKANEQRELNGTGQYFNLLSSSAGKVRIRALDSDAREIISTEILNGDSVEFERLVAKLYVTASEDAAAVLYFSQHKLVNNGVSISAPGNIRTKKVSIDGQLKLNSVTAQNKEIHIKATKGAIFIGNQISGKASGYKIEQGNEKAVNLSGDVYGFNDKLEFSLTDNEQQQFQIIGDGAAGKAEGRVIGSDLNCFVRRKEPYQHLLFKNGVEIAGTAVLIPDGFPGAKYLDDCGITYANGAFYIYYEKDNKMIVVKTERFEQFETVIAIQVDNMAVNGSSKVVNVFDNIALIRREAATGTGIYKLNLDKNTAENYWETTRSVGDLSYKNGIVFTTSFNRILRTDSNNNLLDEFSNGVRSAYLGCNNDLFMIEGNAVKAINENGVITSINVMTDIVDGAVNYGFYDEYIIAVNYSYIRAQHYPSGQRQTAQFTRDAVSTSASNFGYGSILESETEVLFVATRGLAAGTNGLYKTPVTKQSGSVKPSEVQVLELF